LRDPLGLATDILSAGALLVGVQTQAILDAQAAADVARAEGQTHSASLIIAGQSLAGGMAQVQVAYLQKQWPGDVPVGFITMNAAYALPFIRRLGIVGKDVAGVNFSKDLDPGVGPYALFANRVGLQIYIHPDGGGGSTPSDRVSLLSAIFHPREHFLESFNSLSLAAALMSVVGAPPQGVCR
jgi:hypothetical protein